MTTPVLNKEGLEKAASKIGGGSTFSQDERVEMAGNVITAYLSASLPADVAGVVERLQVNAASWRRDDCLEGRDESEADLNAEAAALISALSSRAEVAEYKLNQAVNVVHPMLIARTEAAEARVKEMEAAGASLANIAFNLSQRSGLSERDRTLLEEAYKAWDAARSALGKEAGRG